jgi:ATP-dependent DNA helicase RecG
MNIFADIAILKGVGSKSRANIEKLISGKRVIDLLLHLPNKIIDRAISSDLEIDDPNKPLTIEVTILKHQKSINRLPYKVHCVTESSDEIEINYFNVNPKFITELLPVGSKKIISGKIRIYNNKVQITHPEKIIDPASYQSPLEANYPLTIKLGQNQIQKLIQRASNHLQELPEWIDEEFMQQHNFLSFTQTIKKIHQPGNHNDITHNSKYIRRLAYDEFLSMQLALNIANIQEVKETKEKIWAIRAQEKLLRAKLSYKLTLDQEKAIEEIINDLNSTKIMNRLLQGDVGTGKTIVAAISCLYVIEAGFQAAFMVPTSILAKQQYDFISSIFDDLNIKTALLTGKTTKKERNKILSDINSGEIKLLIGTHALIYEEINFHKLALTIIDEQHRFGVNQRINLINKGQKSNFLLMSATPIPRTLTLSLYGDLALSIIKEKPANRQNIETSIISNSKINDIIAAISRALENNEKIYWICPLVNEIEDSKYISTIERYNEFKRYFGDIVGMVHGQMKQDAKDQELNKFINNQYKILIATTVIEVGVNVTDATIMIIENAESYGLSQLHQLRGRIGRGNLKGKTLLIYDKNNVSKTSLKRLAILRETNDGFEIAEKDLELRGSGEILGTKQSGLPQFKIASLEAHKDLLIQAHKDAKAIIKTDPYLLNNRGMNLRILLEIFNYKEKLQLKNYG